MNIIWNSPIARLIVFIARNFGEYTLPIFTVAVLSFISSILDGLSVTGIIPMFSFLTGGGGATTDLISGNFQRFFALAHVPYNFRDMVIFISLLYIGKTGVLFLGQNISIWAQRDYEIKMRTRLFSNMLAANWTHLSKQRIGYLEQIMLMGVEQGSKFMLNISNFFIIVGTLAVYSLLALNISVPTTLLTLSVGVLVFYGFKPFFQQNKRNSELTAKQYKKLSHYVNENIIGMKSVKASHVEDKVMEKAASLITTLATLRARVGFIAALSTAILTPIPFFFIIGIFAFSYTSGSFNFATFIVMIYAINRVFNNFQSLQSAVHTVVSFLPYVVNAHEYDQESIRQAEENAGERSFVFKDSLELKNVGFAYESLDSAISGLTITIKRGEFIGLIGPSGAGKTTIVDLLLRLLTPTEGAIELDGVAISDIRLSEWRKNVGYVSQDIFLFNGTIADNIRFYNKGITENEIIEAACLANIHNFIMELPEKYKTVVGERGIRFSGGQRQRIVLARVLARKPQLLILDEATSALDNESEIEVHASIEGLKRKITVLVIAHRLSTVLDTDKLIVLEKGRIIEEGSPQKLLEDESSYFSRVYNLRK